MGKPLSEDRRLRSVDYILSSHSARAAGRHFQVGESIAIKLMCDEHKMGSVEPKVQGRPFGVGKIEAHRDWIISVVSSEPDITLSELCDRLEFTHGVRTYTRSLSALLSRAGYTYKKLWSPPSTIGWMLYRSAIVGTKPKSV